MSIIIDNFITELNISGSRTTLWFQMLTGLASKKCEKLNLTLILLDSNLL